MNWIGSSNTSAVEEEVAVSHEKLHRSEWLETERPVAPTELRILQLIRKASKDTTIVENGLDTLYTFLKIPVSDNMSLHLYHTYFKIPFFDAPSIGTVKLKKADVIRLGSKKDVKGVYESLVVDVCCQLWKKAKDVDLYNLYHLRSLHVVNPNPLVLQVADATLATFKPNLFELVATLPIAKPHADVKLYDHQKKLFEILQLPGAKLVMYMAPTGTGKTLSPVGISKFVMVCAARHVALDLAKNCVAVSKPLALAFGCESATDVRLHHNAASSFTRDKRTGGIAKVDNLQGEKVDAMICDMASYEIAMRYMLTFNKPTDLVVYWDEPTISMDRLDHPSHDLVRKMWACNEIPNVVLSSATLPRPEEMESVVSAFCVKFNATLHVIESYDCEKTVRVLDNDNMIVMPHFGSFEQVKERASHLSKNKTLLRYVDYDLVVDLLKKTGMLKVESLADVTVSNVKLQYAAALEKMDEAQWALCQTRVRAYDDDLTKIVTSAAWTIDGPAVYLCDDVNAFGDDLLKQAAIPPTILAELMKNLESNTTILDEVARLQKDMDDANSKECEKEKKMADGRVAPLARKIQNEVDRLLARVKVLGLPQVYVPNTLAHAAKYRAGGYCAMVDEEMVGKILQTEVDDLWKLLLLMGVGLLSTKASKAYAQLIKDLASNQRLFLIVADADHVYGTNYPFTHAYLGDDLSTSKTLQAMGRVGRGDQLNCTVRVRNGADLFKKGEEGAVLSAVLT